MRAFMLQKVFSLIMCASLAMAVGTLVPLRMVLSRAVGPEAGEVVVTEAVTAIPAVVIVVASTVEIFYCP